MTAGVIGHPAAHSLSPRIHGFWLRELGIDGAYAAHDVAPARLADALAEFQDKGFRGLNVTLPHKETVVELLDEVRGEAERIGAVNTIVYEGGRAVGYNTDIYGFAENLKAGAGDLAPYKKRALVLGAGGAARAVIAALQLEGWQEILVSNRTQTRADELADFFGRGIGTVEWKKRESALPGLGLLVNATSLGMKGQGALELPLADLSREALVTDIVYSPLQTPLLAEAAARGNKTVDGLGMLLHQAVPGFEMWFGKRPLVSEALRAQVPEGLA